MTSGGERVSLVGSGSGRGQHQAAAGPQHRRQVRELHRGGSGHRRPTAAPAAPIDASGACAPPPEKRISTVAAAGDHDPSAPCSSDGSASIHEPSADRTHCGRTCSSTTNVPCGVAKLWLDSVRADRISTRTPCCRAAASADRSSGTAATSSGSGGSLSPTGCAAAGTPPSSEAINPPTTATAVADRGPASLAAAQATHHRARS